VPLLEAEVAGQPATAAVEDVGIDARAGEQCRVGLVSHDRVVVAVRLDVRGALHARRPPARGVLGQEFGEGDALSA
jgi:hypothetical protein